jgi:hypothetical protein
LRAFQHIRFQLLTSIFSPQDENNGALLERGCVVLDQPQRLDHA